MYLTKLSFLLIADMKAQVGNCEHITGFSTIQNKGTHCLVKQNKSEHTSTFKSMLEDIILYF